MKCVYLTWHGVWSNWRAVFETVAGGFYDKIKRPRKCLQREESLLLPASTHMLCVFSWLGQVPSHLIVQTAEDAFSCSLDLSLCSIYRTVGGPNWRLVSIAFFSKSMREEVVLYSRHSIFLLCAKNESLFFAGGKNAPFLIVRPNLFAHF